MSTNALKNPHLPGGSFFLEGGPAGVLLIHGYTATTAEVRLLGDYLAARGLTVSAPLLPGHGTTPEDIRRYRWQDWAVCVEEAYTRLRARCATVFVGGSSMGGLLTLHLATTHPEIAGLMVYATALQARSKLIALAPLLWPFVHELPKKRGSTDPENVVNRRWQGYTVDPVAAAAQLYRFQRVVRGELGRVQQPILIVQGQLDRSVDPRSASVIYEQVSSTDKQLVWLARSSHVLLLDLEWEDAAAQSAAFIQRLAVS